MNPIFDEFKSRALQTRVRVKITRATQARPIGEGSRSVSAGEIITCNESDAGQLVAAGAAKVLAVLNEQGNADAADAAALRALLNRPVNVEREPIPSDWRDLPEAFQDGWVELSELRSYAAEANEWSRRSSGRRAIGERAVNMLGQLHEKCSQAQQKVRGFNRRPLWGAIREASRHTVAEFGKRAKLANEVRDVARELFNLRISALGLTQWKADQLYRGSTLFALVEAKAPVRVAPNLRLSFSETGEQEPLIDADLPAMACYYRSAKADQPQLEALLKELQGDLAKAQRAMRKAAA